jgi:putative aminopeptidase
MSHPTLRAEAVDDLLALMRLFGLAGHEGPVAAYLRERFEPLADEVREDTLGNLIATVKGSDEHAPSVMLFAHMDSLGFVVRRIDDSGYVYLHRLGGIPEKVLPGLRVVIGRADGTHLPGVIAVKAHHVTPPDEKTKVTPLDQLYVDIGASSKGEAHAMGVRIGAPVTYTPHAQRLGEHRVSGTFIDNRSGCLVLLEVLRHLAQHRPKATVFVVATVQEEFNLRGAQPAAHALQPDIAICIDISMAGDTPDLRHLTDLAMGEGPTLNLYSFHGRGTLNGLIPHPALVGVLQETAERAGLPLHRNVTFGGLTDASYVQLVGDGIASIDVGFPARYTHTPIETCDVRDIAGLVAVLTAFFDGLGAGFDLRRSLAMP